MKVYGTIDNFVEFLLYAPRIFNDPFFIPGGKFEISVETNFSAPNKQIYSRCSFFFFFLKDLGD